MATIRLSSLQYNIATGELVFTGRASTGEYTRILNGVTYFNRSGLFVLRCRWLRDLVVLQCPRRWWIVVHLSLN